MATSSVDLARYFGLQDIFNEQQDPIGDIRAAGTAMGGSSRLVGFCSLDVWYEIRVSFLRKVLAPWTRGPQGGVVPNPNRTAANMRELRLARRTLEKLGTVRRGGRRVKR